MSAPDSFLPDPPRLFIDADVFLAAAFSPNRLSASNVILRLCELGLLSGNISGAAREEIERNCQQRLPAALPDLRRLIASTVHVLSEPSDELLAEASEQADAKDVVHLATALDANCQFLVTFNVRHYRLAPEAGVTIADPGELLRRIRRAVSTAGRHEFADPEDASKEG